MPTYDYKCDACRHKFEQSQSITAGPLKKCPHCGKLKLKRLLGTGVGVIFKGSGFYETDYRSDSYKKAAQSDKPASSTSTESKTETKKESKPATETKTESKSPSKKEST
jgi:putative FmdB family regulatory protein